MELPSILEVVNAKAAEGALEGSPLEAEEETMTGLESPMPVGGRYWVTSPRGDLFAVAVAGRPDGGFAIEV